MEDFVLKMEILLYTNFLLTTYTTHSIQLMQICIIINCIFFFVVKWFTHFYSEGHKFEWQISKMSKLRINIYGVKIGLVSKVWK